MNKYNNRKHLGVGHIGKLEKIPEENPKISKAILEGFHLCTHIEYCQTRKNLRDADKLAYCFGEETIKKCQSNKYYDRYPNWIEMGIGSRM